MPKGGIPTRGANLRTLTRYRHLRNAREIRAAETIFHISRWQAGIGLLILRAAVGLTSIAAGVFYLAGR